MAAGAQHRTSLLNRLASGTPTDDLATVLPRAGGSRVPLSSAQDRLWFLDQLEPGSSMYTMPEAFRLTGELDRSAFQRAFRAVVDRHEVLRATFPETDGEPYQRISAAPDLTYEELPEAAVAARVAAEAERTFDLAAGPLVVATLIRVGERDHVLLLNMHHIVFDGWSMDVFLKDWAEFYRAELTGAEPALAPLPIQYADYAVWQRRWLDSPECAAQLAYWRDHLAGAPAAHSLPTHDRPELLGGAGAVVEFEVPARTVTAVRELSRSASVTTTMFLLAAFQVVLARVSGVDDIVVGLPTAGRSRPEVEPLVGFFVNTLALRTDLSGDPTFRVVLDRVREVALAAYSNQDVPFERLVEELRPERSLGRLPVFQIMFSHEVAVDAGDVWPGLTAVRIRQDMAASKFDVGLSMAESGDTMTGELSYRADLFAPELAGTIVDAFQRLLAAVTADPDRPLGDQLVT